MQESEQSGDQGVRESFKCGLSLKLLQHPYFRLNQWFRGTAKIYFYFFLKIKVSLLYFKRRYNFLKTKLCSIG